MTSRIIRCSALPLLFQCAHSQDEADLLIESAGVAADLGTAAHDALRSVVANNPPDLRLISLRHGVEEKELAPLVWFGRNAWQELRASFPGPETEVKVSYDGDSLRLTGHIDLISIVDVQK